MNQDTYALTEQYIPERAIIVYKTPQDSYENSYYLESHKIDKNGKLLEGNPLTEKTLSDIAKNFVVVQDSFIFSDGLLPDHLIFFDNRVGEQKFAWYRAPEKKMLYFSNQLNIKSGLAWVPGLLYVVNNGFLNVYSLNAKKRPTEATKLKRAPFHNVDDEGSVCLGNAKVKKPSINTIASHIKYWEDMFWLSEFSHIHGVKSPTKKNINTLWKSLINTENRFPESELKISKIKTVKEALI